MKVGSTDEQAVLKWIFEQAKSITSSKRVLLFGSRARGDAESRSDFDIALETDHPETLPDFRACLENNPLTLLSFDIVVLSQVSEPFRKRILQEAKDISDL